jgi:agmatinase
MVADWLTWCGVPRSTSGEWNIDKDLNRTPSDMAILGVPYDAGATAAAGQADAPFAIRRLETFESWVAPDIGDLSTVKVVDCGDADIDRLEPSRSLAMLGSQMKSILKHTGCLVMLGGDHSISTVGVNALEMYTQQSVNLIHFDAHSDTWDNGKPTPNHASWVRHTINMGVTFSVHQFGIRAMSPEDDLGINRHCGPLTRRQLATLVSDVIDVFAGPVYLSIDMDVLDPAYCPGVAYPEPGGWQPSTLFNAIEKLVATGKVKCVDIVETTPSLDRLDQSVRLAHRSVLAVRRGLKLAQK